VISVLAFILECAVTAAATGTAVAMLVAGVLVATRPLLEKMTPAKRADLTFMLATGPAALAFAVVMAAAAPSLASAFGLAPDHCTTHSHHVHLCIVHSAGLRPVLATAGAFSLAVFIFRAWSLARRLIDSHLSIRALEVLGTQSRGEFPIVRVPGSPSLCHATGIFRLRILLSAELAQSMTPDELRAALAHEAAHLRRRDPAALLMLSLSGLFAPPLVARMLARPFQEAAEQACDTEAACAVGDAPLVAAALVKVVALQQGKGAIAGLAPAFGESLFERRVQRLLELRSFTPATARSLALGAAFASTVLFLALLQSPFVHHAVETALHHHF
jgi:Zn-dependent protease with chaperone function